MSCALVLRRKGVREEVVHGSAVFSPKFCKMFLSNVKIDIVAGLLAFLSVRCTVSWRTVYTLRIALILSSFKLQSARTLGMESLAMNVILTYCFQIPDENRDISVEFIMAFGRS